MIRRAFILVFVLNLFSIAGISQSAIPPTETEINAGWEFRQAGTVEWMTATVPGCVHTDLLANRKIDDPFYRDNEKNLQWIGKTDWEYRTNINVTAASLGRQNLDLVFYGLDTYAEVYLNEVPILSADNMFRTWRVPVKDKLRVGSNTLRIKFRSPINEILPIMKKLDYELPASNDQGEKTSPYTRKAPYQFGWDWGPRFVTSGVWRPVKLHVWDAARVEDFYIRQDRVSTERADLTAVLEIAASSAVEIKIVVNAGNENQSVVVVKLAPGVKKYELPLKIANPRLWYPAGLGEQALYDFKVRLVNVASKSIDQRSRRTGLRTLELRRKPDQYGVSFEFIVNGIPVFGRGANWIPADIFPTRVTKEKYRELLTSLKDANMNMLRVWGGGIYEDDYYYDLADEMGILVWQDFMFACSMYPGDRAFLENVRQEAIDNVKRLRNHPSIVIWAGNNEIETAWLHWGWKERLPNQLWDDYLKLFARLLPEVLDEYDPLRPYWQSSPSSNFQADPEFQGIGDTHYWQVWHAEKPYKEYEKQFPRFMSEYGFQSFPELETVKSYTTEADRSSIETPVMLAHQRHPRGNQLVREYMLREYDQPKDFESFLYVSQVLQAEGIKIGAEHFRRIMPRNMGSLYWQANDVWPVASWSGMDYFGRWKALMYYTKRFYAPMLISPTVDDAGNVNVTVVSDSPYPKQARMTLTLMDFAGKALNSKAIDINIEPLKGRSYFTQAAADFLNGADDKNSFLLAELEIDGRTVSQNEYFFKPFKELNILRPNIATTVTKSADGFRIVLATDKLARSVYLSGVGDGFFSDNYFNLIPGRTVEIEFRTKQKIGIEEFRGKLKVRSLIDAFK
ncbi:MAG: glycoside hydrolase family 2 protein [Acidobacteria bacterium]|nr:glycoside hydrolase family 2 protein [Acidobacteriota bacterium]